MKSFSRIKYGVRFRLDSLFLRVFALFDYIRSNKNVYNEPSVCAFYQCYKKPKAVITAISSFRSVYPSSTVHLFCDSGDDMSHIAKYFDCKYEYITSRTGNGTTLFFLKKEHVLAYLSQLLITAQNSTEDFILILEDDLKVLNKIKKLKFDWNSTKATHHYSGRKLTSILRTHNKSIPFYICNMYFAGSGGAVMNRNFYLKNFSNVEKLSEVIDELSPYIQKQWPGALPQDAILTALVLYFGGTVGWYPGFSEVQCYRYKLRPMLGEITLVHNDKSMYNLPLSDKEKNIFLGRNI